jgi:signal transduction histidine kinase
MASSRPEPKTTDHELSNGIPVFLDQIIETLTIEQSSDLARSELVSGLPGGGSISEVGDRAAQHGRCLLALGFTLEQVVRDYGDVCQAVTNLAVETRAPIEVEEFRTFNRCLDNAISGAVTEYSDRQTAAVAEDNIQTLNSRLGSLAHELRNHLHVATHAIRAMKSGNVGLSGATGAILDRSLLGMRSLVDRSLADVRLTAGLSPHFQAILLAEYLGDAAASAALDPRARECQFTVMPIESDIAVFADPEMLSSAIGNLLQNAFKFTRRHSEVRLHAHLVADRVLIEVEDHCGGLPAGAAEDLLLPFVQSGEDRSGLGLGLDICRRSVEANDGVLRIRDLPGTGCIFTIDLPRPSAAQLAVGKRRRVGDLA